MEYLRADAARIKMTGGVAHINLDNFNTVTRNLWRQRDNAGPWPKGSIGFPTQVAQMSIPNAPRRSADGPASLDNTYGGVNPSYNPTQHRVQNPTTKQSNYTQESRQFKQRTVAGGKSNMARGAAGLVLAVNAINWSLETYGNFKVAEDRGLVSEHLSILTKQVTQNINDALDLGMIPEQYQNIRDLGNIANVVLSGVNPTDNQEIYDIGIDIVKQISGNYQQKFEIIYPRAQDGQDKTRAQPIIVPVLEKE